MIKGRGSIGVLLGILLLIVVFAPVPGDSRFINTLHDAAHGPIFGTVAVLVLLWLRARAAKSHQPLFLQYAAAFVVATAFGLATEIAQALTNRDASWLDLRNDMLGALAFLLLFYAFDGRVRSRSGRGSLATALIVALSLCAFLAAPVVRSASEYRRRDRQFPTLVDFTRSYDRYFVMQRGVLVGPTVMPARWAKFPGESAMQVQMQGGEYPGVELIEPSSDWSAYSSLLLDLTNPGPTDLAMVVRIHDAAHTQEFDDRFNRAFTLHAGSREILRIALEDVRRAPKTRALQLDDLAGMIVFSATPAQGEFLLSRAWLE